MGFSPATPWFTRVSARSSGGSSCRARKRRQVIGCQLAALDGDLVEASPRGALFAQERPKFGGGQPTEATRQSARCLEARTGAAHADTKMSRLPDVALGQPHTEKPFLHGREEMQIGLAEQRRERDLIFARRLGRIHGLVGGGKQFQGRQHGGTRQAQYDAERGADGNALTCLAQNALIRDLATGARPSCAGRSARCSQREYRTRRRRSGRRCRRAGRRRKDCWPSHGEPDRRTNGRSGR